MLGWREHFLLLVLVQSTLAVCPRFCSCTKPLSLMSCSKTNTRHLPSFYSWKFIRLSHITSTNFDCMTLRGIRSHQTWQLRHIEVSLCLRIAECLRERNVEKILTDSACSIVSMSPVPAKKKNGKNRNNGRKEASAKKIPPTVEISTSTTLPVVVTTKPRRRKNNTTPSKAHIFTTLKPAEPETRTEKSKNAIKKRKKPKMLRTTEPPRTKKPTSPRPEEVTTENAPHTTEPSPRDTTEQITTEEVLRTTAAGIVENTTRKSGHKKASTSESVPATVIRYSSTARPTPKTFKVSIDSQNAVGYYTKPTSVPKKFSVSIDSTHAVGYRPLTPAPTPAPKKFKVSINTENAVGYKRPTSQPTQETTTTEGAAEISDTPAPTSPKTDPFGVFAQKVTQPTTPTKHQTPPPAAPPVPTMPDSTTRSSTSETVPASTPVTTEEQTEAAPTSAEPQNWVWARRWPVVAVENLKLKVWSRARWDKSDSRKQARTAPVNLAVWKEADLRREQQVRKQAEPVAHEIPVEMVTSSTEPSSTTERTDAAVDYNILVIVLSSLLACFVLLFTLLLCCVIFCERRRRRRART